MALYISINLLYTCFLAGALLCPQTIQFLAKNGQIVTPFYKTIVLLHRLSKREQSQVHLNYAEPKRRHSATPDTVFQSESRAKFTWTMPSPKRHHSATPDTVNRDDKSTEPRALARSLIKSAPFGGRSFLLGMPRVSLGRVPGGCSCPIPQIANLGNAGLYAVNKNRHPIQGDKPK